VRQLPGILRYAVLLCFSVGCAVAVPISPSALPNGAVGSPYSQTLNCDCSGNAVWSFSGNFPGGLSLNGNGSSATITGTPTDGGSFSFTISVQFGDAGGSQSYSINIAAISPSGLLLNAALNTPFSQSFSVVFGAGSYTFSCPNPPPGLSMSAQGTLSGTPTSLGTFNFNVVATLVAAQGGFTVSASEQLTVINGLRISSSVVLPNGVAGSSYSQTITASGGRQPYSFTLEPSTVVPNALPQGLSLTASGVLSGIPTAPGNYGFTIDVTDSNQATASAFFQLIIAPPLSITTASPLPTGSLQTAYSQTLAATGGNVPYHFSAMAGQLPAGLVLQSSGALTGTPTATGTFTFTAQVTDNFGYMATKQLQISIAPAGPLLQVSPAQLSFSAVVGGDNPAPQTVAVAAPSNAPVNFAAQILPVSGVTPAWITIAPAGGAAPAAILVTVTAAGLTAATYQATIQITVLNNTGQAPINVTVSLTVSATAPTAAVSPAALHFLTHAATPGTQEQVIAIANAGGTPTVSIVGGSSWVTGGVNSGAVQVDVNSQGLGSGSYHEIVRIKTQNGSIDVPVSLFVQDSGPAMALSVSGLRFQARQGAGLAMPQTVFVLNLGDASSTVNWSVDLLSGSDWLSIGTSSGTSTPNSPGKFTLMPAATIASLAAGPHYALVRVSDPNSQGAPQYLNAVLDIQPSSSAPLPDPSPAGLFFTSSTGAQTIFVYTSSSAPVGFGFTTTTSNGAGWLSASSTNPTASTMNAGQIAVSVNAAGLAAGVYYGTVNIEMSGAMRTVGVTLVVLPGASTSSGLRPEATSSCAPSRLAMTQTGLAGNFAVPAGWPATLIVQLNDDCGNTVASGNVLASFSSGDPPLSLRGDGVTNTYSATWQPLAAGSETTITLRASAGALQTTQQITGVVNQNPSSPPSLIAGGALNIFFNVAAANATGYALAPGSVIQIYGSGLAPALNAPGVVPLLNTISGTFALIGSTQVPLFFVADSVLAAQVPFELTPNRQYQIIISANGALTLPESIDVVAMQPGVDFSISDGSVVAQRLDGSLVSAAQPAQPGEKLTLYLTGMGATNPAVSSGAPTPLQTVPATTQPLVTLDGQNVDVGYAGLTPTGVGLYQINLTVPANARAGNLPLVIMQNGVAANATTLPVGN